MSDHTRGIVLGLGASALWATVFVAGRIATAVHGVDPIITATLRFTIGAVLAIAWLALAGRWQRLSAATRDWWPILLLGAVGIFAMGVLVFVSTALTSSINGALILNANAIFIAVFALLIGERVPGVRFVGLIVGLAGCGVIVLGSTPPQPVPVTNNVLGSLAALGGAICWAAYTVAGKQYVRRWGGPETSALTLVFGALLLAVFALVRQSPLEVNLPALLAITWLGVFPTAIAMLMWYRALELVDASVLGPTQYIAPIGATLLGYALLREPLSWQFAAGAVAIIVGVYLATRPARKQGA